MMPTMVRRACNLLQTLEDVLIFVKSLVWLLIIVCLVKIIELSLINFQRIITNLISFATSRKFNRCKDLLCLVHSNIVRGHKVTQRVLSMVRTRSIWESKTITVNFNTKLSKLWVEKNAEDRHLWIRSLSIKCLVTYTLLAGKPTPQMMKLILSKLG